MCARDPNHHHGIHLKLRTKHKHTHVATTTTKTRHKPRRRLHWHPTKNTRCIAMYCIHCSAIALHHRALCDSTSNGRKKVCEKNANAKKAHTSLNRCCQHFARIKKNLYLPSAPSHTSIEFRFFSLYFLPCACKQRIALWVPRAEKKSLPRHTLICTMLGMEGGLAAVVMYYAGALCPNPCLCWLSTGAF